MAPQKETIMVLKVDLDCPRCYKKVKKLLCQSPQIHDQIYNEKQNTVMIKVICCSPEKIRDKLCCKGGKSIKSIEILQPKKPVEKPPQKPADPAPVQKPEEQAPPLLEMKKPESPKPKKPPEPAKPEPEKQKPAEPDPTPGPAPVQCPPVCQMSPVNMCCPECYSGYRTGPCYHGYGYGYGYGGPAPPPPPPAFEWGYYGGGYPAPRYNNYKPGYCVSRCGDYISDENPTACFIM